MVEEVDKGAAALTSCRLDAPASWPSLPDEIVFEFLLWLPIKNLHQCNCVSKRWRSLISSPGFIQAHKVCHPDVGLLAAFPAPCKLPRRNHFHYCTLRIRQSEEFVSRFEVACPNYRCDQITEVIQGLVCFYNHSGLFLCNVFTGEVMPLPNSSRGRKYFLGFDVVDGVYKLLAVNLHSVEILTLGLGCCWRMVSDDFENGDKRKFLISELWPSGRSFCASSVLYWMVIRERSGRKKVRCWLVSFDLNKEKFQKIKVPRGLTARCLASQRFVEFSGRLALSIPTYTGGYRLSLHVLEDDEGNTWTKHSIALPQELNKVRGRFTVPAGNLPDGRMLLVNPLVHVELSTPVFSYDPQTHMFERFFVGKFPLIGFMGITELASKISCVEENLTPFDDLFGGVKRTLKGCV